MTTPDPFVLAVLVEAAPEDSFVDTVTEAAPSVEVVWTPYTESEELRSARGQQSGRNTTRLETPPITEDMRQHWQRAHMLVAIDLPDNLDTLAPNLQWIQSITAGYDKYDLEAIAAQGVRLTTASGVGAASISEFVMARLLQVWKNFRIFDQQQTDHEWQGRFGTELTGRTIGIIGLGAIGRQVAKRARAFGMVTLATRASARPGDTDPDVDELHPAADLDSVLARCDAVVAAMPSNPTTIGLFNKARFDATKPGAIFVNVGRGAHVIQQDLIAALESGHLQAAALDVTTPEPLPADDPLWDAPNLYLSPHSSVSVDRYMANIEALVADNLRRYFAGEPLINEVDTKP